MSKNVSETRSNVSEVYVMVCIALQIEHFGKFFTDLFSFPAKMKNVLDPERRKFRKTK